MKICRNCLIEKPLSDFYKHDKMLDGHLNKCKECVKSRVNAHREKNIEAARQYDKARNSKPHRVMARKMYIQTEEGKEAKRRAQQNYQNNYPLKRAAHIITGNAIRDGKIVKQNNCSVCNSNIKIEAHHDDYTKPFEIRWLCKKCHNIWHLFNKPIYK